MQRRLTSCCDTPRSCQSNQASLVNLRCISTMAARLRLDRPATEVGWAANERSRVQLTIVFRVLDRRRGILVRQKELVQSAILGMPGEEFHDCSGEEVVAIAGDHMSCTADIDEVDLGEA